MIRFIFPNEAVTKTFTELYLSTLLRDKLSNVKRRLLATRESRRINEECINLYDLGKSTIVHSLLIQANSIKLLNETQLVIFKKNSLCLFDTRANYFIVSSAYCAITTLRGIELRIAGDIVICFPTIGSQFCTWNTRSNELKYAEHHGLIAVELLDENRIISSGSRADVKIWNLQTLDLLETCFIRVGHSDVTAVAVISPTSIVFACMGLHFVNLERPNDLPRTVDVIDVTQLFCVRKMIKIDDSRLLVLHNDPDAYPSSYEVCTLAIWNMDKGLSRRTFSRESIQLVIMSQIL
jgi:WD40 repeat protein